MPRVVRLRAPAARNGTSLLVAAALLGWALADVPWPWRPPGHGGAPAAVCGFLALALVQSVPSIWRRRLPGTGLSLALGALALRTAMGLHTVSGLAAVAATGYAVGAYGSFARRHARPLIGVALVAAVAAAGSYQVRMAIGLPGVLLAAGLVAGDAAVSRQFAAEAALEAAQAAERARIARELHDVLAHQLSAITIQAGAFRIAAGAAAGAGREDAAAVDMLGTVERLAREAVVELGQLLGVLRRDGEPAARRPAPCLREVPALISAACEAGVAAEIVVIGQARALPSGAELAAYRIVQEALTNVVKHAPGASTQVVLRYLPQAFELSVVNGRAADSPSRRPPPATARLGLIGMQERAQLHGGCLTATALPDGGFAVHAHLPHGPTGAAV
jgi:signal transduction histidine kinase